MPAQRVRSLNHRPVQPPVQPSIQPSIQNVVAKVHCDLPILRDNVLLTGRGCNAPAMTTGRRDCRTHRVWMETEEDADENGRSEPRSFRRIFLDARTLLVFVLVRSAFA